jgi:23S rRNA pseudouridine2605 synthase
LNKMLAHAGVASRREAEELILQGKVSVNGQVVTELGMKVDPRKDEVAVEGKRVAARRAAQMTWVMWHKPKGVVTSTSESEKRKSALQDVPLAKEKGLLPVGRLDRESSGLVLLTNDNEGINLLTTPAVEHTYSYRLVVTSGLPPVHVLERLAAGVEVEGGGRTEPMSIEVLDVFSDRKEAVMMVGSVNQPLTHQHTSPLSRACARRR